MFEEKHIRLVDGSGSSRTLLQFINSPDMIDVGVSADDLLQREPVLVELRQDLAGITTRDRSPWPRG
jgi:hypothetical protein